MYKDFKNDTWNGFHEAVAGKKIYVWGAGQRGREIARAHRLFSSPWKIAAFIDRKAEKGMELEGYPVISPQQFQSEQDSHAVVLISTDRPGKIAQELENMGVKNYFSYYWFMHSMHDSCYQPRMNQEALEQVETLLDDTLSKNLLHCLVEKRKSGFMDYTDLTMDGPEYFRNEFFSPKEDEIFVDGGGFSGDTVEEFILWTGGQYQKIYTFEPDPRMADMIRQKAAHWHDVQVVEKGLWNEKTEQKFVLDNNVYSSRIGEFGGGATIQCVPLDDVLCGKPCTFLKMDIEGAEIPALLGAHRTIVDHKPDLAICIYHKPSDLWEIPLLLHKWVPEYHFAIRHFGVRYFSTVLFAWH